MEAFPRSTAHAGVAVLGQEPAVLSQRCWLTSRLTKALGLPDPGFILVHALLLCSDEFNRKSFRKAPVFLPLVSCLDLLVSSPLMDPSTSQFNHIEGSFSNTYKCAV